MKLNDPRIRAHIVVPKIGANAKVSILDLTPRAKFLMYFNEKFLLTTGKQCGIDDLVFFLHENQYETIVIDLGNFFREAEHSVKMTLANILRAVIDGQVSYRDSTRNMSFSFFGKLILVVNEYEYVPQALKDRSVTNRM